EADKDEIVKVADLGASDYILKPFQAADLEKKVHAVLSLYYSPTPLLATLRNAERRYLGHDYKLALAAFEEALSIDRTSMRAVYGKAISLDRLRRSDEALAVLLESTRL